MKATLLSLAVIIGLLATAAAKGTDEELIRSSFSSYWKAFVAQDFDGAGKQILPADLIETKKALLPVFLHASQSTNEEAREMAAAFFGKLPKSERSRLSPEQVYECLNRFIVISSPPRLSEVLKATSISVNRVQITGADATIYYRFQMQGISESDTEAFIKKGGKWWLRLKEDPKETAKKFRRILKP